MNMIHHQALNGMEITIVVHMMLYLLFCSTYGQQNPKNGKRYSKSPINIFYTAQWIPKISEGCRYS